MDFLIVIEESDKDKFQTKCNEYISSGHCIVSASCGYSEKYECHWYVAIIASPQTRRF